MIKAAFLASAFLSLSAQDPQAATENKVIGRVGNVVYRESDFFEYIPLIYPPEQLEQVRRSPEMQKQAHKAFLERMVLLNQAKKEGVEKWPEFQSKLKGVTNTLMMQEYMNKNVPTLQRLSAPSEEQIKAHYEANINTYKAEDKVSVRHILVSVRSNESETDKLTDEEALVKARKAMDELAAGKDWQEAASEYSDDPGSKDNGGLYENMNPSIFVPEFAEAVRTQEIGKVGEPIKTRFGYHVIIVVDRKVNEIQPLEQVKAAIAQQLSERNMNESWAKWINSLKSELGYAEGEDAGKTAPLEAVAKEPTGGKK